MSSPQADEACRLAPLLADLGHQLRTPLNGVVGMAGVLGQTRLDPGQQQMAQVIESSGRTLHAMVGDILDLARLEAGRFVLEERPFSLAEAAEALQRRLAPDLLSRGAVLRLSVSPRARSAEVLGDEAVTRQLLSRLVRRALARCDGEVGLSLSLGADGGLLAEIESAAGPRRSMELGAELDIPLCRALAQAMGGALEIRRSGSGEEGSYRLLLPLRLCEAAA
jgi:signal transduction histidine kinase